MEDALENITQFGEKRQLHAPQGAFE